MCVHPHVCPTQRVQSKGVSALFVLVKQTNLSFCGLWDTT